MTEERALAIRDEFTLPDKHTAQAKLRAVAEFQELVQASLKKDHDYGVIPGTQKPTLLKPGAEKIAKLLGLADTYEVVEQVQDWDRPLFSYTIKCRLLYQGEIVSEGIGNCNSMEGKYRWRDAKRACPECGQPAIIKGKLEYGGGWLCFKRQGGCGAKFGDNDPAIIDQPTGKVENDDIFSLVNTFLKMAKKRALVDAALSVGRLSDLFTQDMDELKPEQPAPAAERQQPQPSSSPQQSRPQPKPSPKPAPQASNLEAFWKAIDDAKISREYVPEALGIPESDASLDDAVSAHVKAKGLRLSAMLAEVVMSWEQYGKANWQAAGEQQELEV